MKILKIPAVIFLVLALFGFLDASYLTVQHYLGAIPPCFVTTGCETVLTSPYSVFLGLPVSLLGAVFYLLLFLLLAAYFDTKKSKLVLWAAYLAPIGFLSSLFLLYIQFFILKELCSYCLVSAAVSTGLFLTGFVIIKRN